MLIWLAAWFSGHLDEKAGEVLSDFFLLVSAPRPSVNVAEALL